MYNTIADASKYRGVDIGSTLTKVPVDSMGIYFNIMKLNILNNEINKTNLITIACPFSFRHD